MYFIAELAQNNQKHYKVYSVLFPNCTS